MAVARGEAGFWHLKVILVLGRPGTGWNQKTIQKKSSRSNSVDVGKLDVRINHYWRLEMEK